MYERISTTTMLIIFLTACLVAGRLSSLGLSRRKSKRMNNLLLWAIPFYWPILILRFILRDKPRKTDMSPYDYEQHLKCNRK